MEKIRISVVVVSDSCAEGTRNDESGPALLQAIKNAEKPRFEPVLYTIVPDEKDKIESSLRALSSSDSNVAVIITVGGTGFSPRDVTPEATRNVIEKHANGVVIALIAGSLPMGAYSRLVAGVRNNTFIVNFPGSVKAVKECWDILCPLLPHITCLMSGEKLTTEHLHCNALAPGNISPSRVGQQENIKVTLSDALRIIYEQIDVEKDDDIYIPVSQAYGYLLKNGVRLLIQPGSYDELVLFGRNKPGSGMPVGFRDVLLQWSLNIASNSLQLLGCRLSYVRHSCELDKCWEGETNPFPDTLNVYKDVDPYPVVHRLIETAYCRHIGHFEIGLLQSVEIHQVLVARKPFIGIISFDGAQGKVVAPKEKMKYQQCKYVMTALLLDHHFNKVDDMGDMSLGPSKCVRNAFEKVDYLICILCNWKDDIKAMKSILINDLNFTAHFDEVVLNASKETFCFMTGRVNGKRKFFFALRFRPTSPQIAESLLVPALLGAEGYHRRFSPPSPSVD